MEKPVYTSRHPVIFVGAGEVSRDGLTSALTFARDVVAADGGAAVALAEGLMPVAVIGDFDSLDAPSRAAIAEDRQHHVAEQETTDFEKCLTRVDTPLALAVGFTGERMDHGLAVMGALVRHAHRACIVIGARDIVFHAPGRLTLGLPEGTRVSLFPLARVTGTSRGLRWPIDGLVFEPWGRTGTSNEATGEPLQLSFDCPGMLVILPRECLGQAVAALTG